MLIMLDEELLEYLRQHLPESVVPAAVVILDELPKTPNQKVDITALPAPVASGRRSAAVPVAPRDDLERDLATHWSELFRRDQIGVNENFFRLGGTSLTVMRIVAHVQKVYGCSVAAKYLFENPTIAALADYIRRADAPSEHGAQQPAASMRK